MGAVPGVFYQGDAGVQGSSPVLQGSSPNLQPTYNPSSTLGGFGSPQIAPVYTDAMGNSYNSQGAAHAADASIAMAKVAQEGIIRSGNIAVNTLQGQYQDKVLPFAQTVEQGQQGINQGEINNALSLRRTQAKIGQGVRQGIKSGGVMLANSNATDSGAAPAMSYAYARQGGLQNREATNSAALAQVGLDTSQKNLNTQKNDTLASLLSFRTTEANRIYETVRQQLEALNASTSVHGVVDTHAQDAIVTDALHRLDALDVMLQGRLAAAKGLSPEEIQAGAASADQAGAAANPFAYDQTTVSAPGGSPQNQIDFPLAKSKDASKPLAFA